MSRDELFPARRSQSPAAGHAGARAPATPAAGGAHAAARLGEFVGQSHILGPGQLLRRAIEADRIQSLIFYGPPGTGKTSLAQIIARQTGASSSG
jgi:Cdc6-like AAA superfamily ATPase